MSRFVFAFFAIDTQLLLVLRLTPFPYFVAFCLLIYLFTLILLFLSQHKSSIMSTWGEHFRVTT
jgi:hypothetical protein